MELTAGPGIAPRALILAAGRGSRFGQAGTSKVLHSIRGVPLIAFTLGQLRPTSEELAVAVPTGCAGAFERALSPYAGKTRLVEVEQGIGVVPTIAAAVAALDWTGPLVVAAGDELYAPAPAQSGQLVPARMRGAFIAKGAYRNSHTRPPASACFVEVDDTGAVTAIGDEPRPECWRGTGLAYLSAAAVEALVDARSTTSGFCTWIRMQLALGAPVTMIELEDSVNLNTREDISDADAHVLEFALLDRFPGFLPAAP